MKEWDVFISHASEDKEEFVRPLAHLLEERGFKVWYDEFTIKPGDRISASISKGLANSNCGLIVLSENFIKKEWTKRELSGLVVLDVELGMKLFTIWHGIDKKQVIEFDPILADILAINSKKDLNLILEELCKLIPKSSSILYSLEKVEELINSNFGKEAVGKLNTIVEGILREYAVEKLGLQYFNKKKLASYGFRKLIDLLNSKGMLVSKNYLGEVDIDNIIKFRNLSAHRDFYVSQNKAREYRDNLLKFLEINKLI